MDIKLYFMVIVNLFQLQGLQADNKPTACTERLRHIQDHTACLPPSQQLLNSGITGENKPIIVSEHNKYRNDVTPPATNMLKMYWDEELSLIAQSWASNCRVEHDPSTRRNILGVYQIGQNIAWDYNTWPDVIEAWYQEVKDFQYAGNVESNKVGHYTQVVWADSTRVGCGFATCSSTRKSNQTRFYVCDYAPAGNRGGYKFPYKNGTAGEECGHRDSNLCDCGGKACENGGALNRTTCECKCIVDNMYFGDVCKLDCEDTTKKELSYCRDPKQAYVAENCPIIADVPDRCPLMCNKCPYGDYRYDFNINIFESPAAETTTIPTLSATSRPTTSPSSTTTSILTTTTTELTTRSPRVCKDKYMTQRGHTACLQPSDKLDVNSERNVSSIDIALIVAEHNRYRANVAPPASNMLSLSWDPEIAMIAQVWAETCNKKSDSPNQRRIPGRYDLGQNMAVGAENWEDAVAMWNKSGETFIFGKRVGNPNYSQLVWASTSRVGCGRATCKGEDIFVCNYGPRGNTLRDNTKPYSNGTTCSSCAGSCSDSLCDCEDRSCENGGILDPSTCTCSCKSEFYKTPDCTLSCDDVMEPSFCYKTPFQASACGESTLVQIFCPNMCSVCPYADPGYQEQGVTPPPPLTTTPDPKGRQYPVGGAERLGGGGHLIVTIFIVAMAALYF